MDEHRIGLKSILRRVWTPPHQRPVVPVEKRYEWLYVYGFVRPTAGQNFGLLMPPVSIEAFNLALQHFSQAVAGELLYLFMDQAGWQVSDKVQVPTHMRLLFNRLIHLNSNRLNISGHCLTRLWSIAIFHL